MKTQAINTFQKQIAILKIDICYDDQHLAEAIGLTPDTFSRRLNSNSFRFDDKQRLKRLAKSKGYVIRF